jgi:thioredoxin 1
MNTPYAETEPSRAEVDALTGPTVVEFGTPWCGYCRAAQPLIAGAFASHPDVQHLKVEDGSGLPLGRAFGVTLWPTLVFMRDGREVTRLVRPTNLDQIRQALLRIDPEPLEV